jgi:DnaJ-class molecular chaperone
MLFSTVCGYCQGEYNFNLEFCDHCMGNAQMKGWVLFLVWVHMPNGLCFVQVKVQYTNA